MLWSFIGWVWLGVVECDLFLAGCWWVWVSVTFCDWVEVEVGECGWVWVNLGESGRVRMSARFITTHLK